jgi:hypothetical protein
LTNSSKNSPTKLSSPDLVSDDAACFARIWAFGIGVLLTVTFPLWIHSWRTMPDFPRINWVVLPQSPGLVAGIEYSALIVLVVALGAIVCSGRRRWIWWPVAVALGILILMDQHRLQPWAYQTLLYASVLGALPWREGRRWIIAIAISIYFFSAAGKLDYQFAHTVGSQMVQALAVPIGGLGDQWAAKLALALPISELAIAAMLVCPRTRRIGGGCAIAMHVTLIGLLGPWSLGHSPGVLAWNALLATQSWVLFVRKPLSIKAVGRSREPSFATFLKWPVRVAVLLALLAPLTERFGYWDHWTSWALYSPHNSRVEIQIHGSGLENLPMQIQGFVAKDVDQGRWGNLDFQQWSLRQRRVPIYPQARYQLALALQLARRHGLEQSIRVKTKGVSDRWSGQRKEKFLIGRSELDREMKNFWLRVPQ